MSLDISHNTHTHTHMHTERPPTPMHTLIHSRHTHREVSVHEIFFANNVWIKMQSVCLKCCFLKVRVHIALYQCRQHFKRF